MPTLEDQIRRKKMELKKLNDKLKMKKEKERKEARNKQYVKNQKTKSNVVMNHVRQFYVTMAEKRKRENMNKRQTKKVMMRRN